jgi:hypothetical protein
VTSLIGSKEVEHHSPGLLGTPQLDHPNEDNRPEIPGTPDRVKFSNNTTTYTNSGHWTSILDGVSLPKSQYPEASMRVLAFHIVSALGYMQVLLKLKYF